MSVAYATHQPDPRLQRLGSYRRISRDREGTALGIKRQDQDLNELARSVGGTIVRRFSDNDITGSGDKERAGYEEMVEALRTGEITGVLATEVARFQRGHREYMAFFETCEQVVPLVIWKGGTADFGQSQTLFQFEIWAVMARQELRLIKERCRRKQRELKERGMPNGGGRAFGFEPDMMTHRAPTTLCRVADRKQVVVDEPAVIRDLAKRVLAGESMHALARELNEREVPTVHGVAWRANTIRQILRATRISGRRETFVIDGKRRARGEVTAPGQWKPIISVEESDALRALMADRHARQLKGAGRSSSTALLSGLLFCNLCGSRMYSNGGQGSKHTMKCHGCGGVRVRTDLVTGPIVEAVIERVNQGDLDAALREEVDTEAAGELVVVEQNLTRLATAFGAGSLSYDEWEAARTPLVARKKALQGRVERSMQHVALAGLPHPLRGAWADLSVAQRRSILAFFIARIEVKPAKGNGRGFRDRVAAEWKR